MKKDHLVKLHGLKILKSQKISDTVNQALARYFDEIETPRTTASTE